MKRILKGIISENPTFVLLLGLCPALAVTTKFENAYLMGLCVMIVLLFSNIIVSIIKKHVNENVKIPVFILIIGTFVTTLEILLEKYIPNLYEALGIYLPLIVVNCIVLGRAIEVASKESVKNSILDAIGVGLGFTLAISLIALIREVLGTNTITLMDSISSITGYRAIYTNILPNSNILPMQILVSPAGSFLVLGMLIALFNKIGGKKNDTN
ncbi:MAG: electron transport complex subunit RsxE [Bacilli bacterium]|jgi:electron transport complex protein RnfE|nr:electron transport complex subunit RsxE [Bacilli bacterium]